MIQSEVTEIKKILTNTDCSIHGLAGCYVDANKEMHVLEQGKFLVLPEEEQHKYFDLIKKGLSGRIGKNLLNLAFRTENGVTVSNRDFLMEVLNCELKNPQILQTYFEKIRDSYPYVDNYYIMLVYGVYDVPGMTADGIRMEDASDVVYKFNLTLICPMKPSKAGLVYNPVDNSLENAMRNMMVELPMNGFLFPAFHERMSDVHAALYYTKKPSELNDGLLQDVFGCEIPATAGKQNEMFIQAIESVEEMTFEKAKAIYSNMREHEMEIQDSPEEAVVDKKETARILEESGFEEEEIAAFTKTFDEATQENGTVLLSNVFEGSNKLKIKSGKTEVSLPVEHTDAIDVRKIDGKNCIVIEINDELLVNGVKINKFEGGGTFFASHRLKESGH